MIANGLKRSKVSMILLGITALCLEAIVIADSLSLSPDNQIVFGIAALMSCLTAALYAHNGHVPVRRNGFVMHKPAAQPRFAWRYILAGMVLSILPFLLILHQSYKIGHGTTLRLPVQISRVQDQGFFPKLALTTPLNQISTKSVAGENHFIIGKKVFVFLSPRAE